MLVDKREADALLALIRLYAGPATHALDRIAAELAACARTQRTCPACGARLEPDNQPDNRPDDRPDDRRPSLDDRSERAGPGSDR